MESHLTILSESLDRKLEVLQKIQEYNKRQEEIFSAEKVDISQFDAAVEEKQHLIDEVVRLDDGFEIMYEKLAKELEGNRQRYATQIKELQAKVAKVTELSMSVQAQEARNKKLVEHYFARERAGIGQRRKSAKSAFDYYKSMSGAGYVPPQMYDNKQ
ncbi:flagellar export chaperone FlgN [Waltera intestinalis]|uniref:Flagellar protein FlgN n=1 Tax=Waltera intestinalis TaxID=2606635 RepID=A0A6L5YKR2_9FIRM|nr:flagellar export chaperone FlgN [Waltera intestinalis]MST58851.1 flagellar protein FlgN [Waltera intestinalis]